MERAAGNARNLEGAMARFDELTRAAQDVTDPTGVRELFDALNVRLLNREAGGAKTERRRLDLRGRATANRDLSWANSSKVH
jgi:hypothetical protein